MEMENALVFSFFPLPVYAFTLSPAPFILSPPFLRLGSGSVVLRRGVGSALRIPQSESHGSPAPAAGAGHPQNSTHFQTPASHQRALPVPGPMKFPMRP